MKMTLMQHGFRSCLLLLVLVLPACSGNRDTIGEVASEATKEQIRADMEARSAEYGNEQSMADRIKAEQGKQ